MKAKRTICLYLEIVFKSVVVGCLLAGAVQLRSLHVQCDALHRMTIEQHKQIIYLAKSIYPDFKLEVE